MMTIARNAIYAATVITLWPSALSAHTRGGESLTHCPPLIPPPFVDSSLAGTGAEREPGLRIGSASPTVVRYQMSAGRLKPQLERILRQHMGVQHIVWRVAEEHQWPSNYLLEGETWAALIESLLTPYQLHLQLFANHSAVISYLPTADAHGRGGI